MKRLSATVLLILFLFSAPVLAQDNQSPPQDLTAEEQQRIDQGNQEFAEYLSWFVIFAGGTIFIFAVLHIKKLFKD